MEVEESDNGIVAVMNRRKHYFCSNECRDAFLKGKT